MNTREKMIEELMKQSETEFFNKNGYNLNSQQKKFLKNKIEKIVDRKMKIINDMIM